MCNEIKDYYFNKLKVIKNNSGMTITEMARFIGINRGALSTNFNKKCFPSEKTHKIILSKFNINPNFFFFDEEDVYNKTTVTWSEKSYKQKIKEIYNTYGLSREEFSQKITKKSNNLLNCLRMGVEVNFIVLFELVHTLEINPAFFYFDNEPMYQKKYLSSKKIDFNSNDEWLTIFKRLNLIKSDFDKINDEDYKNYIITSLRKRLSKKIVNK